MGHQVEIDYSPAGKTIGRFHRCDSFFRILIGPLGSAKTTACCMEVWRRIVGQAADNAGLRRSRWLMVRSTYLAGLGLANAADADHDITVAAGECRDAAHAANIVLASATTKRIDATWSAGTGNGGRSSSVALANGTWYHVFAILVNGSADVGFDASVIAANLIADHDATAYRRLGSVLTDASANIIAFLQSGDWFLWLDPPLDVDSTSVNAATQSLFTISVPTGLRIPAWVNIYSAETSGNNTAVYVRSPEINDEPVSLTDSPLVSTYSRSGGAASDVTANPHIVLCDTMGRVAVRAAVGLDSFRLATLGWWDDRGNLA